MKILLIIVGLLSFAGVAQASSSDDCKAKHNPQLLRSPERIKSKAPSTDSNRRVIKSRSSGNAERRGN